MATKLQQSERALAILSDANVHLEHDHFVYVSGDHGSGWINKDVLYLVPDHVRELTALLAQLLTKMEADVVCGPATGGLVISQWLAWHLNLLSVFAEHDPQATSSDLHGAIRPPFVIRRHYDQAVRGKRIIVVDDIINTGHSFSLMKIELNRLADRMGHLGAYVRSQTGSVTFLLLVALAIQSFALAADTRVTLHFPARSVGTLVTYKSPSFLFRGDMLAPAAGDIVTTKNTLVGLKLNYDGSTSLAYLDKLMAPNLVALEMSKMAVEDSEFAHLRSLTSLRHLAALETELGNTGMLSIAKLTSLEYLDISRTLVTGEGFRAVSHLPNLVALFAASLKLDDDCATSLDHLTKLSSLGLGSSCLSDRAMVHVAKLKNLSDLHLARSPITDKGLALVLANCKGLSQLDVANTDVTVKSLPALQKLPKLSILTLTTRKFTPAQLTLMHKTLPHCLIKDENPSWAPVEIFNPLH